MNRIIIKTLKLVNFKGVRDLTIDFNEAQTNIYGRNGSGKTTIFDAFTWLLFGKDSSDRKQFDLKTLDKDGNIIPQLPHEVSAVILYNDAEIKLMRRFTEKWVKRAGKVDKEFDGNKEERFINDVPVSKKEYEERIADICREDVFKFITSPTYFTSQKAEAQKAMLHQMAGSITDAEVAAGNSDFEQLLDTITGKSLADYKREIASKKSHINAEITDLPGRIDEKQRDIAKAEAEADDWAILEAELKQKREARAALDAQVEDVAEQQRSADSKRAQIIRRLSDLKASQQMRISEIKGNVTADYYQARGKRQELMMKVRQLQQQIEYQQRAIAAHQAEVQQCETNRGVLIDEWKRLNDERATIAAEQLEIDEATFVCPTCHRPLDINDIEEKEALLHKNFETERAERLARIADAIERNKRNGIANNERKTSCLSDIEAAQTHIENTRKQIADIEALPEYTAELSQPDASAAIAADEQLKQISIDIAKTEEELNTEADKHSNDVLELKGARELLTEAIEELIAKLARRTDIDADRLRLADLEAQMQTLNVELSELEKQEFVIAEFSKARNMAIEARINGLFKHVRFRWLSVAINGTESETCEATINGVPYASLNHAGQIIAGLDIINAICRSQSVSAPIFIDNAESINDLIPMQSQIINLIVSRDEHLRVEA